MGLTIYSEEPIFSKPWACIETIGVQVEREIKTIYGATICWQISYNTIHKLRGRDRGQAMWKCGNVEKWKSSRTRDGNGVWSANRTTCETIWNRNRALGVNCELRTGDCWHYFSPRPQTIILVICGKLLKTQKRKE